MADETPVPTRAIDVAYPQDVWRGWVRELQVTLAERDATLTAYREIVAAVADGVVVSWRQNWSSETGEFLPQMNAIEIEDRIYQQACALLATSTSPSTPLGAEATESVHTSS